ncbi:MAG: LptF/LptG family permease [Planctomycetota bacterium]|jgi:lipopolysaccharide export system permease protein
MPRLLSRYILGELLRSFGLTCAVLATVIAFGAAVKPLTQEGVLTSQQLVKYVSLAIVPMLQFALPFAAGFAATTTFYRLTTDNEILAMAVGGLSYRQILAPVIMLGLVLTVIMVALTQSIIPRFWGIMERTITTDITRVFQATIDRGVPFEMGRLQIYADRIFEDREPEGTDADTRFVLLHVAAAELDDTGRIITDITARQAVVDIYRRPDRTILNLVMTDAVAFKERSGELVRTPQFQPARPIEVPSVLRDSLVAMGRGRLLHLREHPDDFGKIIDANRELADALRDVEAWRRLDRALREDGTAPLRDAAPTHRHYVVTARALDGTRFAAAADDPVTIVQYDGDRAVRRFDAAEVRISRSAADALGQVNYDLSLRDYTVTDIATGAVNERQAQVFPNLTLPGQLAVETGRLSSADLLARAAALDDPDDYLARRVKRVRHDLEALDDEINSRLLKRYALSATAILLLLLGATLAMVLRQSLPLTIYLWAFLPSVLDLLLISGGEQSLRDGSNAGIIAMWSGNAILFGLIVLSYWRLSRH